MNNSDQDKQDQSTNSGMETSTAMTIEYLRVRLLAERNVSKSAKDRADELAKRVAELVEELRIVSQQRMKAEKTTKDILAILENRGISDRSETFDSSSDQDTPSGSQVGNRSSKEEENSVSSKVQNNPSYELSGSDLDSSPVPGRSLSWKGCKDGSGSVEKYKDPSLRRRNSFASASSSPKRRSGKSCRQVRRKESRPVAEVYKANPVKRDSPEDEIATPPENFPNCNDFEPKSGEERMVSEDSHSDVGNERHASASGLNYNVYRGDRDMEKALERQAKLIGQYEAMEKAQKEWEEKFRENNSSTPDSCDPGNRSDVTEERYDIRPPDTSSAIPSGFQTQEMSSEVEDLSKLQPSGFLPSSHNTCLEERNSSSTPASESFTQDFAFPMAKGKQNQESPGNNYHQQSHMPQHNSASFGSQYSSRSQSLLTFPSTVDRVPAVYGSQGELYALVPQTTSDGLNNVLESLKEARQSLQQKINSLPLVAAPVEKSVEASVPTTISGDKFQIPVGSVGLFRLPTDFAVEGSTQVDMLSSSSRFRLGNHYSDRGVPAAVSNQLVSSPYLESRSSLFTENQFLPSQYVEGGSRIPMQRPNFNHYLDTGLPPLSRYTYPSYPVNSLYPDLMPQMPSREAMLSSATGTPVIRPSSEHLSFIDDNIRPNMYR